jgi:hypothetical protein
MKKMIFGLLIQTTLVQAAVTVSGISSGGFMAAQLGVIYSDEISGVGTVAGGFYGCASDHFEQMHQLAESNFMNDKALFLLNTFNPIHRAVNICMKAPTLAIVNSDRAEAFADQKLIADTKNIKNQKVYIYQGQGDKVVSPKMQKQLKDFYLKMSVPEKNIQLSTSKGGHNFPTDQKNLNACSEQGVPYISSCNKNVAGEILNFLVSPKLVRTKADIRNMHVISQKQDSRPDSISEYGYLVSSQKCLDNPAKCNLHVALHGCEMNDSFSSAFDKKFQQTMLLDAGFMMTGIYKMRSSLDLFSPFSPHIGQKKDDMGLMTFVKSSGYADYVEKNNLMVLFPQTQISEKSYPYNPKGCWDWIGTSGSNHLTNKGVETAWLMDLIHAVQKNPNELILN